MRHWQPYIQTALAEMEAQGVQHAVGLAMAPHYSRMSIGAYFKKIEEAGSSVDVRAIEDWHLEPGYLDSLAERVEDALQRFPAARRTDIPVLFTAHSLPQRILEWHDPYPVQLNETVCAVMERLGDRPRQFAFQSAAISSEPWLGPDAGKAIADYAAQGQKELVLCPIGFVCEHVEILYDVDVVYQSLARTLGMHLERIEMLGTAPRMIKGLSKLVRAKAEEAGWL